MSTSRFPSPTFLNLLLLFLSLSTVNAWFCDGGSGSNWFNNGADNGWCGSACVIAAQCNNQCSNSNYESCVCQDSCLCAIKMCSDCCDNDSNDFCGADAGRNLQFCRNSGNTNTVENDCSFSGWGGPGGGWRKEKRQFGGPGGMGGWGPGGMGGPGGWGDGCFPDGSWSSWSNWGPGSTWTYTGTGTCTGTYTGNWNGADYSSRFSSFSSFLYDHGAYTSTPSGVTLPTAACSGSNGVSWSSYASATKTAPVLASVTGATGSGGIIITGSISKIGQAQVTGAAAPVRGDGNGKNLAVGAAIAAMLLA